MAISHSKKESLVAELNELFAEVKLIACAEYAGTTVQDLQELRAMARKEGVKIKVVKNRLVKVALQSNEKLKGADQSFLRGQLIYAISSADEVMPAKILDKFQQDHPEVKLAGGIDGLGNSLDAVAITNLAKLPSRDELIAQTVAQLLSPVNDTVNALSGALPSIVDGLAQHANN